jgi:DNA polymerase-4
VTPRQRPDILHLDLDAFYASVEQRDRPELVGRPVVVGGTGHRGVVAAASYEARRFGVHSAMPTARARRACPDGVFLAPRFEAYAEASRQVMAILRSVTPLVEPLSLDEAFLDVAGARREGTGPEIGATLRARIRAEVRLTASVGAASTKLLAKLASDMAKPDGLLVVPPGTELAFLHPLPVSRLWGVGPATQARLAELGVETVGQLAALPESSVVSALGRAAGAHLYALAHNRDERVVEPDRPTKSVGHEETFATDRHDRAELERDLARMAERVAARLRDSGLAARTVAIKVRFPDFRTITRSHTLGEPTDLAPDIGRRARELLRTVDLGAGVRLLGVAAQQLSAGAAVQERLPLGGDAGPGPGVPDRSRALAEVLDAVRHRFGDRALGPAHAAGRPPIEPGARLWGPEDEEESR